MARPPATTDWWAWERDAWRGGVAVGGIDEVGRGCIAGPVYAACVVFAAEADLPGLNDSKKLSPAARERLAPQIRAAARGVGIGSADAGEIDSAGIVRATHLAMQRALAALPDDARPALVLVDGLPVAALGVRQRAIVRGDATCASIAAASIVAKVERDAQMALLDAAHPGYGLAAHKGYGTAEHIAAVRSLGPSPIHRRSFAPIREDGPGDGGTRADGTRWEAAVRAYLERRPGWRVIAENYRSPFGEIDLVAEEATLEGRTLVFIEVKARRGLRHGSPLDAVNRTKQERIAATARHWIGERETGGEEPACRFDIADVRVGADGLAAIRLVQGAFDAP